VGLGLRHFLERQDAEGAGLVLHHEGLAEALAQLLAEHARDDVGRAARRIGHEDAHRLARILVLSGRRADTHHARGAQKDKGNSLHHGLLYVELHAALTPCRLCEASFTVKNTTSRSAVASPEWTTLDGT